MLLKLLRDGAHDPRQSDVLCMQYRTARKTPGQVLGSASLSCLSRLCILSNTTLAAVLTVGDGITTGGGTDAAPCVRMSAATGM